MQTRKPIAVIAGDIHYSLNTLAVADAATRLAIQHANTLGVPFIANGDTHDSKANLRGECVNAMIETFKTAKVKPYVNIGNHCKINEKSVEHSLNFLAPYATIVNEAAYFEDIASYVIPYYHDRNALLAYLRTLPAGSRLIMHQGVEDAVSGEYIQDKSAIPASALALFRTILSHYHTRHDIVCGPEHADNVGTASYIGNAFTLNYAEADDPPKGFQVLYHDGSLEFVPTNLRKHVVLEATVIDDGTFFPSTAVVNPGDLVKVKLTGPRERLTWSKNDIQYLIGLTQDFKLEIIPLDTSNPVKPELNTTGAPLLDSIIDGLQNTSGERKERLKALWKAKV